MWSHCLVGGLWCRVQHYCFTICSCITLLLNLFSLLSFTLFLCPYRCASIRVLITLHCTLRLDVPQSINMYTLNMLTLKEHKNTLYLSSATPKDTHRFKLSLFFAHSFSFPPLSPSPLFVPKCLISDGAVNRRMPPMAQMKDMQE